jgi:hypothetical protein
MRREPSPRASEVDRGDAQRRTGGTTRRRHLSLTGQGHLNDVDCRAQHAAFKMHPAQSVLADNQITLADEADSHAHRAAHRRTTFCAGARRAAAAAALEAQATMPGSSTSCGQARSTTTRGRRRRSARELSGTRSRCSFRRRTVLWPTSDSSAGDTQHRVFSLWVRVPGGKLSQQRFQPMAMSRCMGIVMYGAFG